MTWKDDAIRAIDARGRRYQRELESEWVRAAATFQGGRTNGLRGTVAKGRLLRRTDPLVERYPDKFEHLDPRMIEGRVKSFVHRLRVAGHVE